MAIVSLAIGIPSSFPIVFSLWGNPSLSPSLATQNLISNPAQTHLTRDTRPVNLPASIALEFGVDGSDAIPIDSPAIQTDDRDSLALKPQANPQANLDPNSAIQPEPTWSGSHLSGSQLFQGGPNSLVARAVGSAEGTRRPDGSKNPAYYGHRDPGNAKWNLGSFSYQHEARSPEDADQRQLRRLQTQDRMLQDKARAQGLQLTLEERLNGLDLANQAPLAALDRGGYIDRLKEARDRGLRGEAAILHARVNSYRQPDTNLWDAPGLGNNEADIRHDQARRMDAVGAAIALR